MATSISDLPEVTSLLNLDKLLVNRLETDDNYYNYITSLATLKTYLKIPDRLSLAINNIDNTSDKDKPLSDAMKSAISSLANKTHTHEIQDINGLVFALKGITDRLTFIEQAVSIDNIKANIDAAVAAAIAAADFNNHTQDYTTIIGLETYVGNAIHTANEGMLNTVNTLVNDKVAPVIEEMAVLTQSVVNKADIAHEHQISDVIQLQWYIDRITISPLDLDNGIAEDNW